MIDGQPYHIPQLATIILDTSRPNYPTLKITLAPDHRSDLNDLAQATDGPDNVIDVDHTSVGKHAMLKRFMEVLEHHDYTGDGLPDCDEIRDTIEAAFPGTQECPTVFNGWPYSGLYAWLVQRIMPTKRPMRHIVMGYGKLTERIKPRHYPVVIVMLLAFIGLVVFQNHTWGFMQYSPITASLALTEHYGFPTWLGVIVFVLVITLMRRLTDKFHHDNDSAMSPHTVGFFSKAAVLEEQTFREGSENWTMSERVRSCVAFGLIHQINLFYPLSTIVPLTIGGGILMMVYLRNYRKTNNRRAAVMRAAVWHRVYNRVALTMALVTILVSFGAWVAQIAAGFLALALLGMVATGNAHQLKPSNIKAALVEASK